MASKSTRSTSKGSFTRSWKALREALDANVLLVTASKKYDKLKQTWDEVQLNHQTYLNSLADETQIEEEDKWILEICNQFDKIETEFDNYVENKSKEKNEDEERKADEERRRSEAITKEHQDTDLKIRTKISLTKIGQQEANILGSIRNLNRILETTEPKDKILAANIMGGQLLELEVQVKHLSELIDEILAIITDDEIVNQINETYGKIIHEYNEIKINGQMFSAEHKGIECVAKENATGNVRLEKLKFQTFEGDMRKYPKFREEFLQHIKPHYKTEEEAFVLKHYLSSDIANEIENLGNDAAAIWQRLDLKYGDKSKLVDMIMSEFKAMKRPNEKPGEIINMINTVEKAHRDLKMMGKEAEINNSTIVSMLEEKLPKEIDAEWIKLITTKGNEYMKDDKFPALLSLLLEHKERLE